MPAPAEVLMRLARDSGEFGRHRLNLNTRPVKKAVKLAASDRVAMIVDHQRRSQVIGG